jgi:hypothetical protein
MKPPIITVAPSGIRAAAAAGEIARFIQGLLNVEPTGQAYLSSGGVTSRFDYRISDPAPLIGLRSGQRNLKERNGRTSCDAAPPIKLCFVATIARAVVDNDCGVGGA